jgi:large subunit ribosomal protein L23Ae
MPAKAAPTKATKAAGGLKKGSGRKSTKIHTGVHFFKPNTLKKARAPTFDRKSSPKTQSKLSKAYDVIKYPLASESAIHKIEADNTLVFIVATTANKSEIKRAVKQMYDIKADKINTLIRPDGSKKAFVKLSSDLQAMDVANRLGVI